MSVQGNVRVASALLLALGSGVLAGCSDEPQSAASGTVITDIITNVTARNGAVVGLARTGAVPVGTGGPGIVSVEGISSVVNGGSAEVSLTGSSSFQRVYIRALGADGYFEVTLPSEGSVEDLVMSIAPNLYGGNMRVQYTLEGGAGVGTLTEQTIRVIRVGTGDVQVSVAWTGESDVDLSVMDPAGELIYFGNLDSESGGRLDLDSNPACSIDGKNNENIVWPVGNAPAGEYAVFLTYYDDCGVDRSDWVVTVQVKGQTPRTFTGSFVGESGSNPSVPVATITY